MALRVRGETVEEITGAAPSLRAADDADRGAGGRHRHLRHRRRRGGHLQHLDRGRARRGRPAGVPVAKHGNRAALLASRARPTC